ncbi:hypothetical protein DFP72DRAFT_192597 [Ephemerocybe angulata]|uniref:Uncharacterized protein n=1 Tax=Ephemerocybe angulata TaxID=980116 RepID=A0A8H6I6F2_9AGAR|nr:hypothetical protein DFP72DRAFT_192597 [Tulosesus angulatus]
MPTAAVLDSCSMEHPARPPSTTRRTHQNDVGDLPRPADSDLVASPSQTTSSTRTDPVGREGVRQGQNELDNVRQAYLLVLEHDEDDPLDGTMSTDPRRRRRRMHLDLDDSQHAAPCQVPVNDAQNTRTTWKTYRMPARHRCPTYSPSLHHHKRRRGSIRQATLNTERKCVRANTSLTTCNSLTCVLSSAAAVARVDGRRRHQLDHNTVSTEVDRRRQRTHLTSPPPAAWITLPEHCQRRPEHARTTSKTYRKRDVLETSPPHHHERRRPPIRQASWTTKECVSVSTRPRRREND